MRKRKNLFGTYEADVDVGPVQNLHLTREERREGKGTARQREKQEEGGRKKGTLAVPCMDMVKFIASCKVKARKFPESSRLRDQSLSSGITNEINTRKQSCTTREHQQLQPNKYVQSYPNHFSLLPYPPQYSNHA